AAAALHRAGDRRRREASERRAAQVAARLSRGCDGEQRQTGRQGQAPDQIALGFEDPLEHGINRRWWQLYIAIILTPDFRCRTFGDREREQQAVEIADALELHRRVVDQRLQT